MPACKLRVKFELSQATIVTFPSYHFSRLGFAVRILAVVSSVCSRIASDEGREGGFVMCTSTWLSNVRCL